MTTPENEHTRNRRISAVLNLATSAILGATSYLYFENDQNLLATTSGTAASLFLGSAILNGYNSLRPAHSEEQLHDNT